MVKASIRNIVLGGVLAWPDGGDLGCQGSRAGRPRRRHPPRPSGTVTIKGPGRGPAAAAGRRRSRRDRGRAGGARATQRPDRRHAGSGRSGRSGRLPVAPDRDCRLGLPRHEDGRPQRARSAAAGAGGAGGLRRRRRVRCRSRPRRRGWSRRYASPGRRAEHDSGARRPLERARSRVAGARGAQGPIPGWSPCTAGAAWTRNWLRIGLEVGWDHSIVRHPDRTVSRRSTTMPRPCGWCWRPRTGS